MGSLGGQGSMSTSGPSSPIKSSYSNDSTIRNDNDVHVSSYNYQFAATGSAKVSNNTTGGSATSGNASNNNSSSTQVSINNGGQGGSGGKGGGPGGQGGQGGTTVSVGGQGGGQVLGASFTVASLGGGMGGAQLPNTGIHQGLNPWIAIAILTILASGVYWRYAIMPKLKSTK
jgi:hypothetical protein